METPPIGHPVRVVHPVLPASGRLWGAGRPSYPDEPPTPHAVAAGVRGWRAAGVNLVVSLIEDWEVARRAPGLFDTVIHEGLALRRFPIPDFGVPGDAAAFEALLADVVRRLDAGDGILVHCNAGLGRTAVVLASVLRIQGLATDPVLELRRIYRPTAMEEPVQEGFVRRLRAPGDGRGHGL
jgi:hypothetical protein